MSEQTQSEFETLLETCGAAQSALDKAGEFSDLTPDSGQYNTTGTFFRLFPYKSKSTGDEVGGLELGFEILDGELEGRSFSKAFFGNSLSDWASLQTFASLLGADDVVLNDQKELRRFVATNWKDSLHVIDWKKAVVVDGRRKSFDELKFTGAEAPEPTA